MIAIGQFVRHVVTKHNTGRLAFATAVATSSATKKALKELRQKTGFSYVNCRKALNEFGPDNLDQALRWLKETAVKEGWEKAAKLGDRPTRQGLVSVLVKDNRAAVVELNCETDFVSRNENFKRLVEKIAVVILNSQKAAKDQDAAKDDKFALLNLTTDCLKTLQNNKLVKDAITEAVIKLGENITLSRAYLLVAKPDVQLFGYAHPKDGTESVHMGRYVSVVGLRRSNGTNFPTDRLGEQLCQHIVGMRSLTLGTPPSEEAMKSEISKIDVKKSEEDELNAFYEGKVTHIDEDETRLLRQAFMLNPAQTVHEYITGHGASIADFYRIELGENVTENSSEV